MHGVSMCVWELSQELVGVYILAHSINFLGFVINYCSILVAKVAKQQIFQFRVPLCRALEENFQRLPIAHLWSTVQGPCAHQQFSYCCRTPAAAWVVCSVTHLPLPLHLPSALLFLALLWDLCVRTCMAV